MCRYAALERGVPEVRCRRARRQRWAAPPRRRPLSRRLAGVSQQASYVDGLWDGRPVRDWIPEVIDDVVAAFDPVRVIVFGSVARREDRPESDLDLLVLFDDMPSEDRRSLMGKIRGAISAPIPIDVLVGSVTEYEALKDVNGSPYYWPAREGRVAHERPAT